MHSRTAPVGDTANSCFGIPVGEPRGVEYRRVSGPGLVYTVFGSLHGRLTGLSEVY